MGSSVDGSCAGGPAVDGGAETGAGMWWKTGTWTITGRSTGTTTAFSTWRSMKPAGCAGVDGGWRGWGCAGGGSSEYPGGNVTGG